MIYIFHKKDINDEIDESNKIDELKKKTIDFENTD